MLVGAIGHYFFGISIFLTSVFLIMLVLVQRGRGGGIAGALGGAGGQSAFGTKAGDLFTRITVGVATFWILLCCAAILMLREKAFTTGVQQRDSRTGAVSGMGGGTDDSPASNVAQQTTDLADQSQDETSAEVTSIDSGTDDPADESTSELAGPESNPGE